MMKTSLLPTYRVLITTSIIIILHLYGVTSFYVLKITDDAVTGNDRPAIRKSHFDNQIAFRPQEYPQPYEYDYQYQRPSPYMGNNYWPLNYGMPNQGYWNRPTYGNNYMPSSYPIQYPPTILIIRESCDTPSPPAHHLPKPSHHVNHRPVGHHPQPEVSVDTDENENSEANSTSEADVHTNPGVETTIVAKNETSANKTVASPVQELTPVVREKLSSEVNTNPASAIVPVREEKEQEERKQEARSERLTVANSNSSSNSTAPVPTIFPHVKEETNKVGVVHLDFSNGPLLLNKTEVEVNPEDKNNPENESHVNIDFFRDTSAVGDKQEEKEN